MVSNDKPFSVVHFADESVEAVPTSWIKDNGTICMWPKDNKITASFLKIRSVSVSTPALTWGEYPITIINSYGKSTKIIIKTVASKSSNQISVLLRNIQKSLQESSEVHKSMRRRYKCWRKNSKASQIESRILQRKFSSYSTCK